MMEAYCRQLAPERAELFARTIDAARKYSTLDRVDWNVELVRGDPGKAVHELKQEPGKGLLVGGVKLPRSRHRHQRRARGRSGPIVVTGLPWRYVRLTRFAASGA
jgi:hypothetical protein